MFEVIQQNEIQAARRRIYFQVVDSVDGFTPKLGQTGKAYLSKNGAAPFTSSNPITEIDATNMPGRYYLEPIQSEVDTLGQLILRYKAATTAEALSQASVVPYDPFGTPTTVATIVSGVLEEPIESGLSLRQAQRLELSALAGKISGSGTTTLYVRDIADTKNRMVVTIDGNNNRLTVTRDAT